MCHMNDLFCKNICYGIEVKYGSLMCCVDYPTTLEESCKTKHGN